MPNLKKLDISQSNFAEPYSEYLQEIDSSQHLTHLEVIVYDKSYPNEEDQVPHFKAGLNFRSTLTTLTLPNCDILYDVGDESIDALDCLPKFEKLKYNKV